MTAPVRPSDLTATEQRLAALYDDLIAKGHNPADVEALIARQYASATGDLGRAMRAAGRQDINAAEADMAREPGYGEQVNRRLLALTDQVPGAHALVAAGRAALSPTLDYADATRDIRESVSAYNADDAETWRRRALKLAGALPVGAAGGRLAPSVAKASALIGAAGGAGTADADLSLAGRGVETAVGGVVGGLLGKVGDVVGTTITGLMTTRPAVRLYQMQAARAKAAKALYGAAEAEGTANLGPATKAVHDFVNEPDIAEIVADLQQTRQYRGLPGEHPRMLDAIIKELSDRAGMVKKGLLAPTPSRPNVGRIRGEDIQAAKAQGVEAISGPGGPMPSYAAALKDFAQRSHAIEAYKRGVEAVRSEATVGLPPINSIMQRSPETFAEWLRTSRAGPEVKRAAAEGVRGATKEAMRRMSIVRPLWSLAAIEALSEAPAVARTAGLSPSVRRGLFDLLVATEAGRTGGAVGSLLSR